MARRCLIAAITATVAGVLAAACSTSIGSTGPTPATTTTTIATIAPAPKVQHPLDPARMIAAPCTTLTTSAFHLGAMPSGPGQPVPDAGGPSCEWRDSTRHTVLRVTWLTGSGDTLADMYAHWSRYSTWAPTSVRVVDALPSYPGVYASIGNQDSDLYLAVNDNTLCRVHYDDPGKPHPEAPDSSLNNYFSDILFNLVRG